MIQVFHEGMETRLATGQRWEVEASWPSGNERLRVYNGEDAVIAEFTRWEGVVKVGQ